jgi:hypothetical protein
MAQPSLWDKLLCCASIVGLGRGVVTFLFNQFPDRWRVAQEPENLMAQIFWRE